MNAGITSRNFEFLSAYDAQLLRLATLGERYFRDDPNTCLIKLRQFGELLAQEVAARVGLFASADEPQSDLLRRLRAERAVPPPAMDLFHQIRMAGNQATHARAGDHAQALITLKVARELAVWFHRSFGNQPALKAGPFVPPQEAGGCDGAAARRARTPPRRSCKTAQQRRQHGRVRICWILAKSGCRSAAHGALATLTDGRRRGAAAIAMTAATGRSNEAIRTLPCHLLGWPVSYVTDGGYTCW